MKRYQPKATKSPVSLNLLHKDCCCVQTDCVKRKPKTVVLTLPAGVECLNCDVCTAVFVAKKGPDTPKRPDYIIYVAIDGYKPQWVVVEAENSVTDDYAVGQMKEGLKRMTEMPEMFAVRPRPQLLLGLVVHGRRKVKISEKVLMSRKYVLHYAGLDGLVRECPYGTCLAEYMRPM